MNAQEHYAAGEDLLALAAKADNYSAMNGTAMLAQGHFAAAVAASTMESQVAIVERVANGGGQ